MALFHGIWWDSPADFRWISPPIFYQKNSKNMETDVENPTICRWFSYGFHHGFSTFMLLSFTL